MPAALEWQLLGLGAQVWVERNDWLGKLVVASWRNARNSDKRPCDFSPGPRVMLLLRLLWILELLPSVPPDFVKDLCVCACKAGRKPELGLVGLSSWWER